MICLANYRLIRDEANPNKYYVRSEEDSVCPVCGSPELRVIGSRKRGAFQGDGTAIALIIRRLRCQECVRIHHELPDILVPYKRYCSECIEAVLTDRTTAAVAADESTLHRWQCWFMVMAKHIIGCLQSIAIRCSQSSPTAQPSLPASLLCRVWHYVGNAPAWLARAVRPVVNTNNWVQTRSAFLS